MNFSNLQFEPHTAGNGIAARYFFPNGYGVSVVRFTSSFGFGGSYGANEGLYELAVLQGNKDNWELTYDTPITEDVLGYLTEDDVTSYLQQVENLVAVSV